MFHGLMECKVARKFWKYTQLEIDVKKIIREDILSVMYKLMDTLVN